MSLSHPPSKLSPPAGAAESDLIDSATSAAAGPSGSGTSAGGVGAGGAGAGRARGDSYSTDQGMGDRQGSKDDVRRNDAPKRGYRACVHCRLRKARCDLGDVNSPSEPPCSRCRREQRNCVFLPSKRRKKNNVDTEDALLQALEASSSSHIVEDNKRNISAHNARLSESSGSNAPMSSNSQQFAALHQAHQQRTLQAAQEQNQRKGGWDMMLGPQAGQAYQHAQWNDTIDTSMFDRPGHMLSFEETKPHFPPARRPSDLGHSFDFTIPAPNTGGSTSTNAGASGQNPGPGSGPTPSSSNQAPVTNPTPQSVDSTSTSALSPNTRQRRRRDGGPDATRRIVVANFSNETDALEILAHAATDEEGKEGDNEGGDRTERKGKKKVAWKSEEAGLADFVLIKLGILDEGTLWGLCRFYFDHHHPVLPIIQTPRIPRTPLQLPKFASDDPFLLAVIVTVASRYHSDPRIQKVHSESWALVRQVLADYTLSGVQANVGLVEGALLLAEFLPREIQSAESGKNRANTLSLLGKPKADGEVISGSGGGLHGADNRRTWALTGLAIRAAYGLQLDEVALTMEARRTLEEERARLAWTWCYLYDRTIGLRTGLAFWSRGPQLCFTGFSHINQTGEAAAEIHFPSMLSPTPAETYGTPAPRKTDLTPEETQIRGAGADSASLIQALTELTQLMTNAHDTLYPNRMRTSDLVTKGAYFRHLDSYSRALDTFKRVWADRVWQAEHLKELTWCTYEMVRLYVSSFAFQAHVQRAWARAEEEQVKSGSGGAGDGGTGASNDIMMDGNGNGNNGSESRARTPGPGIMQGITAKEGVQLFPRGAAQSPDALYIYASIDAANEILNICLRLATMGVLGYLPSRYLINFVFGGVFALKAGYSGAVGRSEIVKTRELVDRVCAALVLASPDREHPASRYGQMLRLLCRKLEELSDQSAVPSRFPSPEPGDNTNFQQPTADWAHLLMGDSNRPAFSDTLPAAPSHGNTFFAQQLANAMGMNMGGTLGAGGAGSNANNGNNNANAFNLGGLSTHGQPHPTGGIDMTLGMNGMPHLSGLGDGSHHALDNLGQQQHQHHPHGVGHLQSQHPGPGQGQGQGQSMAGGLNMGGIPNLSQNSGTGVGSGTEGLFDFDVDVNFNMDGFWDDFTLAEGTGFPFR